MSATPPLPKPTALLFSGDTPGHVCTTIRTVSPLRAAGWAVLYGAVPGQPDASIEWDRVQDADVILIQRDWPTNSSAYQRLIQQARRHNKPVIYDLDDLLIALPDSHPDYKRYRDCRPHIALALTDADLVTCSTATLASAIGAFASKVQVLPNFLPDDIWQPVLENSQPNLTPSPPLRIGYCGGHAHGADVEMIETVLLDILDEFSGQVQLWFWGLPPSPNLLAREDVIWESVAIENYADFVKYFRTQKCDIFIAPLADTLFNRCKSGLKFLEYSALGIPGVYSRLEPYQELVSHGETGFLAADLSEWRESLLRLIVEPELRLAMGKAAKESVANQWLLNAHVSQWPKIYAEVMAQVVVGKQKNFQVHLSTMVAWHDEILDALKLAESKSQQQMAEKAVFEERTALEVAHLQHCMTELEERLERSQDENADLYRLAHEQRQSLDSLQHQLSIVHGSLGWQLLQTVTPLRYRLLPGGSRREQALQSAFSRFHALRNEGVRGFLRKPATQVRADGVLRGHHQDSHGHSFAIEIRDDELNVDPTVSVVIMLDQLAELDMIVAALQEWQSVQSMPTECVVWDTQNRLGWILGEPKQLWPCENLAELIEKTRGTYVCLASPELAQERATLVEENLVALLSENLAFTLNVKDNPLLMEALIRMQRIPARVQSPFGPSFVHRSCFDTTGRVDLTTWLAATNGIQSATCVGKLLVHTSDVTYIVQEPVLIDLVQPRLRQMGRYFYSVPANCSSVDGALPTHLLYPVDSVLSMDPFATDKPTVLMIMPVLAVGGAEQVHLYMAEQLQKDVRLVIVALEPHTHGVGTSADQFRRYTPYVYTTDDFLIYPLLYSWISYLIQRFQPETLYIANGTNWIYDAIHALKENYPGLRVAGQVYDDKAGWINRYNPATMKAIDVHIGTNQHICDEYLRRGAAQEQVHLIEHCVDVDTFSPDRYSIGEIESLRERFGIPPGNRVVTFMARLHQQKRPMDIVELARRCASDESISFLMVGNGPLQEAVDGEIARTGLQNIIRLPFHKPSSEVFAVTDVYVLPSEYEGMPLVILEAQAMGIPVVVTDVGNNREVIEITGGGVVVDSVGNVAQLRDGVLSMLASPPSPADVRVRTINDLSLKFGILPEQMAEKYRAALLSRTEG
ncbi:MAG: glycosyltransferase [Caldilineaceae bacterium]